MLEELFKEVKRELQNGISKKDHPFRYFTLGTVNAVNEPKLRTVVFRKMNAELELFFYTDRRSNKRNDLVLNEYATALFYHPKKMLQIQINGLAVVEKDTEFLKSLWNGIPAHLRKDYTTVKGPGSPIKNPEEVTYLNNQNHFCVIKIIPHYIEYLRLGKPNNHIRARFYKKNDGSWASDFLVP